MFYERVVIGSQIIVRVTNGGDVATLVIAVVGVVLGAGSLVWQIASRHLERPRLKLALKRAWADAAHTQMVTAPLGGEVPTTLQSQGSVVPYLAVDVQNVGRFPVGVRSVTATMERGFGYSEPGNALNPPRDHRIQPFAVSTWYLPMQPIQAMVDASAATLPGMNHAQEVRVCVEPEFGKPLVTKKSFVRITPRPVGSPTGQG